MDLTFEALRAVVEGGEFALARISTTYEPAGGDGSRVMPPTFPTDRNDDSPYLLEERSRGGTVTKAVVLDQVPSQANRVEEALADAQRSGEVSLPLLRLTHRGQVEVVLTGLEMPHRAFDAYLRDSTLDNVKFDRTDLGKALQATSLADATALLQHDPGTLVFGGWNSHRKGRQAKFPRAYSSEVVGWNPVLGARKAGRMDPLNLTGTRSGEGDEWEYSAGGTKTVKGKLSEIGHGNIAPGKTHGGVSLSDATRFATLSVSALNRIRFGAASAEAQIAARTLLAAYALLGDRLAFGGAGLWLRSGCELVVREEKLAWVGRGAELEEFTLDRAGALALCEEARINAESIGLSFMLAPVDLEASAALGKAIDFSLTKAETTDG